MMQILHSFYIQLAIMVGAFMSQKYRQKIGLVKM